MMSPVRVNIDAFVWMTVAEVGAYRDGVAIAVGEGPTVQDAARDLIRLMEEDLAEVRRVLTEGGHL